MTVALAPLPSGLTGTCGRVRGTTRHAPAPPVAAGLHLGPRGPLPVGGNGSRRTLPHAPVGPDAVCWPARTITSRTAH